MVLLIIAISCAVTFAAWRYANKVVVEQEEGCIIKYCIPSFSDSAITRGRPCEQRFQPRHRHCILLSSKTTGANEWVGCVGTNTNKEQLDKKGVFLATKVLKLEVSTPKT